eukprot:4253081-Amphidinium_carterae.1
MADVGRLRKVSPTPYSTASIGKAEAYYYGGILLIRNFCIPCIPAVVRGDIAFQVLNFQHRQCHDHRHQFD